MSNVSTKAPINAMVKWPAKAIPKKMPVMPVRPMEKKMPKKPVRPMAKKMPKKPDRPMAKKMPKKPIKKKPWKVSFVLKVTNRPLCRPVYIPGVTKGPCVPNSLYYKKLTVLRGKKTGKRRRLRRRL